MYCNHLNADHSPLPEYLRAALARLPELAHGEPGRYPIDGDRLFALVQQLDTFDNARFEAHTRYLDVQYLVAGEERIDYLPAGSPTRLLEDRLHEHDIAFYHADQPACQLQLVPGMFAVFAPGELHRPCMAPAAPMTIKKVVLKMLMPQET